MRRPPGAYHPIPLPRRRAGTGSAAPHATRHRTQDTRTQTQHAPRTHLAHTNIPLLHRTHGRFRKFVASSVVYGRFGFGHWVSSNLGKRQGRRQQHVPHSSFRRARVHVAATAYVSSSPSPCPDVRSLSVPQQSATVTCTCTFFFPFPVGRWTLRVRTHRETQSNSAPLVPSSESESRVRNPRAVRTQDTRTQKPPNPTDVRKTVDCLAWLFAVTIPRTPFRPKTYPRRRALTRSNLLAVHAQQELYSNKLNCTSNIHMQFCIVPASSPRV